MAKGKVRLDGLEAVSTNERGIEITVLERELAKRGIPARKFIDELGIDPSRIMRYKERADGTSVFLCYEENPDGSSSFYILTGTKKTKNWKEIIKSYQER